MEVGLGALGLSPSDFWLLTYPEFLSKYDGWRTANNLDSEAWKEEEIEDLTNFMKDMKVRFPDGKPNASIKKALKEIRVGRNR
jgi:hypothetical protein